MPKIKHPVVKNHARHLTINYILLFIIFLTGGLSLVLLNDQLLKNVITAALALLYLIWGIWHHYEHQILTREVVLEYIGVAGIMIMIFLLVS